MSRSLLRRVAALEARLGIVPEEYVFTPCGIRQDVCSSPPNAFSSDDASPDDRAKVIDLHGPLGSGAEGTNLIPCKSPVDSLFYQAGCLFSASQSLFFRRSVA